MGLVGNTTVVARKNGSVAEMVGECVDYLGGIGSFVSPGQNVAIKVNGSWSVSTANTSAEVVRQVCLLVNTAGPSKVTVYDHTIDGSWGWGPIESAATSAGAEAVILGNDDSDYVTKSVPGVGLTSCKVAKVLDQADVLINVPKLKTHSSAKVTVSLKNHLGTVLDRGAIHDGGGHGLSQGIADLNTCGTIRNKHRLNIVDAINPMVKNGPKYGDYSDYSGILAGRDCVATDYIGTQIIRRYNSGVPENPSHITKAAALGLGTNDPGEISFNERDVGAPVPEIPIPYAVAGLAALAVLAKRSRSSDLDRLER